jgi:hypothetical protein
MEWRRLSLPCVEGGFGLESELPMSARFGKVIGGTGITIEYEHGYF